jgi:hypothetical protein
MTLKNYFNRIFLGINLINFCYECLNKAIGAEIIIVIGQLC